MPRSTSDKSRPSGLLEGRRNLAIAYKSSTALTPHGRNARVHSAAQIAAIAASIDAFGFINPIIVDENNVILAGHARYEAAILAGYSDVPTVQIGDLSEVDKRAYLLADNRIAELSHFDPRILTKELEFLVDHAFDLGTAGFSMADLDFSFGSEENKDVPEPPVELPAVAAVPVSRPGDLWICGGQHLLCGNARDALSYDRLLGSERAQMVFTDPPYNVKIDGHVSGLGANRHREFAEASGEMSAADFTRFLRSFARHCVTFSQAGAIHFICMDWRHTRELLDATDGLYSAWKNMVVWNKTNAGMGSFYRSQHELIFIFKAGQGSHINNFGLGEKGRYRTNVWTMAGANSFRKGRKADLQDHPTVKPVALVADAILDCSHRNGLILDPFCGSGTTLLAAARTGRRGAGIEIDPLYVDVAIRRLEAATGCKAVTSEGERFEDRAAQAALTGEQDQ